MKKLKSAVVYCGGTTFGGEPLPHVMVVTFEDNSSRRIEPIVDLEEAKIIIEGVYPGQAKDVSYARNNIIS